MRSYVIGFCAGFILGAFSLALIMRYSHSAPPKWFFPYERAKEIPATDSDDAWLKSLNPEWRGYIETSPTADLRQVRERIVESCLEWPFRLQNCPWIIEKELRTERRPAPKPAKADLSCPDWWMQLAEKHIASGGLSHAEIHRYVNCLSQKASIERQRDHRAFEAEVNRARARQTVLQPTESSQH